MPGNAAAIALQSRSLRGPVACVDLETTGGMAANHRVIEVGIVLTGSEVKSLREGRANIAEAYAREEDGQIVMVNSTIPMISCGFRSTRGPTQTRRTGGALAHPQRRISDRTAIGRTGIRDMALLLKTGTM